MKKLSILEFKSYCESSMFEKYTFYAEDQKQERGYGGISGYFEFDKVIVMLNPNAITFISGNNFFKIQRVKYISNEQISVHCDVFYVICERMDDNSDGDCYIFVAK